MYIKRIQEKDIEKSAKFFSVIAILGPRQSGKTTLAKQLFSKHTYTSLENIDTRNAAQYDPRTFLELHSNNNKHGLIIDEFQHVPDLLSYIQTMVDAQQKQGYFVLTGSQNFLANQAIAQSLAGRVSLHTLLPLSIDELEAHNILPQDIESVLYHGLYPAIYTKKTPPNLLYRQYIRTYIERDVRQLTQVGDLKTFQTFLMLCAERVGQNINFTEIGKACQISDQTVKRWIAILEASYIIFTLQPYEKTLSKRFIKSPKLYFYDSGLVCSLLKIKQDELIQHPKRGNIFESFVIAEIMKQFYNHGQDPTLYFWKDQQEHEVDCIIHYGRHLIAIEIKSSRTANKNFLTNLSYWKNIAPPAHDKCYVVYGGNKQDISGYKEFVSWQSIATIMNFLD